MKYIRMLHMKFTRMLHMKFLRRLHKKFLRRLHMKFIRRFHMKSFWRSHMKFICSVRWWRATHQAGATSTKLCPNGASGRDASFAPSAFLINTTAVVPGPEIWVKKHRDNCMECYCSTRTNSLTHSGQDGSVITSQRCGQSKFYQC